jgi:hypothetical protein
VKKPWTSTLLLLALTIGLPGAASARSPMSAEPARVVDADAVRAVADALVARHGDAARVRAERGARQAAMMWRAEDGTAQAFEAFCLAQFVPAGDALDLLLARFEKNLEALGGHRVALTRTLREATDLDLGPALPADLLFAALDPFDHVLEDSFKTRVAFVALLNFPLRTLDELVAGGAALTRRDWAEARLVQPFALRVPGTLRQAETAAFTRSDDYISNYNVHTGALASADGSRPFPNGPKLISHWGLRDHIKGMYSDPKGNLPLQRLIRTVMERIVRQEIPTAVVDNSEILWDPVANQVSTVTDGAPKWVTSSREPDTRYDMLLEIFRAERAVDTAAPAYPSFIARRFDRYREIPESKVEALLTAVLSAPVAKDVGAVIRQRLGRDLEPFDIWYDGFKARGAVSEEELDRKVRARYPTAQAFEDDLPAILEALGFDEATAAFLGARIAVDPSRGAGHALGAEMRSDKAHLRTRVGPDGMAYKGFNIAIHELGHNVEQTFTLQRVDSTLMKGVPNTAFTEAFAFLFQKRDMQLLGHPAPDAAQRALDVLDTFWNTYEIAGVGLMDMRVWRWMYAHPEATPAELREAVVTIATKIWNDHYAPVLGVRDTPLLAIYSHMIDAGLYLPDYSVGYLIQFQIERFIEGKSLAKEMERMCSQGRLTPDAWMQGAVGAPLSAAPLIEAAGEAVKAVR